MKKSIKKTNEYIHLNLALLFVLSGLLFLFFAIHVNVFLPETSAPQMMTSSTRQIQVLGTANRRILSPIAKALPATTPLQHDTVQATGDYCLHVPVLFYHHIEPIMQAETEGHAQLTVGNNYFTQQMQYLIDHGYTFLSADALVHALLTHQSLPAKSVVITIDDGYTDIYTYAFPILQRYHIIGNLMIPAGLIGNSDYLTWPQLQQMVKSPYIRVYNHSYSHADVGNAPVGKLQSEIVVPNNELQTKLGIIITLFTYPYGSFSDSTISFLQQHGFTGAFSTLPGALQCVSQIMRLPRIRIGNAPLSEYGF